MTLQISLIGKGGWVLASDRMRSEFGGIRLRAGATKIITQDELGIAIGVHGNDDSAIKTADELLRQARNLEPRSDQDFRHWLANLGNAVWDRANQNADGKLPGSELYRGLLIHLRRMPHCFWLLKIGQQSVALTYKNRWIAGDIGNSARFFVDRFHSTAMTVDQLIFLAAHVIMVGAAINTGYVGEGLDVTFCKDGNMRSLSENETEDLRKRSILTDRKLEKLF